MMMVSSSARAAFLLAFLALTSGPARIHARILGDDVFFFMDAYLDIGSQIPHSRCGVQEPVGKMFDRSASNSNS